MTRFKDLASVAELQQHLSPHESEKSDVQCRIASQIQIVVQDLSVEVLFEPYCYNPFIGVRRSKLSIQELDRISFIAQQGRVTAIISPIGSGRSSSVLLNALAGRTRKLNGSIITAVVATTATTTKHSVVVNNDIENNPSDETPKRSCEKENLSPACFSFVNAGSEHLLPYLTVTETLMWSARLKLPHKSASARKERVNWVIDSMQLINCRHVKVGNNESKGISTGERKRLLIAVELLDESKSILLLDHPTVGIDSAQARKLSVLLRDVSRKENKIIIFSLNQPTSGILQAVDDIALLHQNKLIYSGEVSKVVEYFETVLGRTLPKQTSIADFLIEELCANEQGDAQTVNTTAEVAKLNAQPVNGIEQEKTAAAEDDLINEDTQQASLADKWQMKFKASVQGVAISEKIIQLLEGSATAKKTHLTTTSRAACQSTWWRSLTSFLASVFIVCRRFLANTAKGPMCWIPILMAALQGLLNGGIMFRYGYDVPAIVENTPGPLFPKLDGVFSEYIISDLGKDENGTTRLPLLGLLTHGSELLEKLIEFRNHTLIIKGREGTRCLHDRWQLGTTFGYPKNLPPWDTPRTSEALSSSVRLLGELTSQFHDDAQSSTQGGINPLIRLINRISETANQLILELSSSTRLIDTADKRMLLKEDKSEYEKLLLDPAAAEVTTDIITIVHLLDFVWNKLDWSKGEVCNQSSPIPFYLCIIKKAGCLMDDLMVCIGLHPLPRIVALTYGYPKINDNVILHRSKVDEHDSRFRCTFKPSVVPMKKRVLTDSGAFDVKKNTGDISPTSEPSDFVSILSSFFGFDDSKSRNTDSASTTVDSSNTTGGSSSTTGGSSSTTGESSNTTSSTIRNRGESKIGLSANATVSVPIKPTGVPKVDSDNEPFFPDSIYDQRLFEWNITHSKEEWDRFDTIVRGIIPNMTIFEVAQLVLSPETKGNLSKLSDAEELKKLMTMGSKIYQWIERPTTILKSSHVTRTEVPMMEKRKLLEKNEKNDGGPPILCIGLCRTLRDLYKTYFVRAFNRVKIDILQYRAPRYVRSAWTALKVTGCLFANTAALGFVCFDVLLSFHKERKLYNREIANGTYSPLAFYLGKNLADLPLLFSTSIVLALLWSLLIGLTSGILPLAIYVGISCLFVFTCYGFCYMISTLTPRMEVAVVIAPIMLITWLLLAGFIMRDDALLPKWLLWYRYMSVHRYGWFALMRNSFPENQWFGELPNAYTLWAMGIQDVAVAYCAKALLALGVGFRILGFFFMKYLYRDDGLM